MMTWSLEKGHFLGPTVQAAAVVQKWLRRHRRRRLDDAGDVRQRRRPQAEDRGGREELGLEGENRLQRLQLEDQRVDFELINVATEDLVSCEAVLEFWSLWMAFEMVI